MVLQWQETFRRSLGLRKETLKFNQMPLTNHMRNTSRRDFLKTSTVAGSFFILPSGLLANSPNSRVCTAHIGTGGKGRIDTGELVKHERVQAVGFCDVDRNESRASHTSC